MPLINDQNIGDWLNRLDDECDVLVHVHDDGAFHYTGCDKGYVLLIVH